MAHNVPLVAAKRTVARVYLSATAPGSLVVQGLLLGRRMSPPGPWQPIAGLGPVTINPAENGQLRLKRESESKSLNFLLPPSLCVAGGMRAQAGIGVSDDAVQAADSTGHRHKKVKFLASPPLRVHVLGIRFTAVVRRRRSNRTRSISR